MWLCIVERWNGVSMFLDNTHTDIQTVNVTTDSSRYGFGGYNKNTGNYFLGEWKDYLPSVDYKNCSMALLELYPIVLSANLWGSQWSRKRIIFHCDNLATVHIINRKRSKCPIIMKLIRKLTIDAALNNFDYTSIWLSSQKNALSDALSRGNLFFFQESAPTAAPHPERIPDLFIF